MNKSRLDFNLSFDFGLLALITPVRDYRISWLLNKALSIDMIRTDDLIIDLNKTKKAYFSKYMYVDELNKSSLYLVSNRFQGEYLLPEQKNIDFLVMLIGDYYRAHQKNISRLIADIKDVQLIFSLDPNTLKSKNKLLF